MGLCQIDYVYIVAKAGAVFCRIVVSEDAEAFTLAYGCLGYERNEVVRNAAWQLSDEC